MTQDDIYDGNEKVIECLQFSYRLRKAVPHEWTREERRIQEAEAVQRILDLLGLAEVQQSKVGNNLKRGISGGQKRRLSLGIGELTITYCRNSLGTRLGHEQAAEHCNGGTTGKSRPTHFLCGA